MAVFSETTSAATKCLAEKMRQCFRSLLVPGGQWRIRKKVFVRENLEMRHAMIPNGEGRRQI